jgi:hypothetical protein
MSAPNIAAYAADALGPANITTNLDTIRGAGWTTIVLGLFHIGYPPKQDEAEIFFNSTSIFKGGNDAGNFSASFDPAWPEKIAELKKKSSIPTIKPRLLRFVRWQSTTVLKSHSVLIKWSASGPERCRPSSAHIPGGSSGGTCNAMTAATKTTRTSGLPKSRRRCLTSIPTDLLWQVIGAAILPNPT